ncbi:MAG TPA: hypothetical protein VM791_13750 [Vicinamibacterales bacterium]|nr:hypothetical protein [Vicinamibacterales bacterium]
MNRILKAYLLVTGVGAFIALSMPGLVVLGFFLLVIPGLILSLAPTAFLWGCMFALLSRLFRTLIGNRYAAPAALAMTAAILFAIPWPSLQAGKRLLEASTLPDIVPAAPIRPSGDVRVDVAPRPDNANPPVKGRVRAFSCDNLCVALLFTPGVRSVTVNDSGPFTPEEHREGAGGLATGARTYRLVPKAECAGREIKVDTGGRVGLFGRTLEENRAIDAEWNLKLSTESCVVAEAPISTFDMMLRRGRYSYPHSGTTPVGPWFLGRPRAQISYVEIRDAKEGVSLRRLVNQVNVLAQPFSIAPYGGIENFHFGWTTKTLSNAEPSAESDLISILQAHSTLAQQAPSTDLVPQIRRRLRQTVADPALPASDPAFATIERYFSAIAAQPLSDADLALVRSLIMDERITSYPGIYHLNKVPADQHRAIRAIIVRRLLISADVPGLAKGRLGNVLAESPKDAFSTLSQEERRLLASPDRRIAAAGLVSRLSDAGADAVPLLVEILRHHAGPLTAALASKENSRERSTRIDTHVPVVEATRVAFCRLGDVATPALPQIEAMISGGVIPDYSLRGHGGTDWNLMLVRLGKPLDAIHKPESLSGSEANYRRNLQEKLRRFDPERSCGRF